MQDLRARQRAVYEYVRLAVPHVASHLIGHNAAQGIEALAHVGGIWIKVERIRFTQAEYRRQRKRVIICQSWSSVMSLVTRTVTPLG